MSKHPVFLDGQPVPADLDIVKQDGSGKPLAFRDYQGERSRWEEVRWIESEPNGSEPKKIPDELPLTQEGEDPLVLTEASDIVPEHVPLRVGRTYPIGLGYLRGRTTGPGQDDVDG